jgi:NADPH:quinone reductase-like Zn-dependent oxidoreductase
VAKGFGARVIAVVSTEAKGEVARTAGADEVVLLDGFRDAVKELGGADIVVDVVGGDVFMDSLRVLRPQGRLMVVGFAAGQGIPEVKVNRLLLNNVDVRGVGWGAYAMVTPGYMQEQWAALLPLMEDGTIAPPIGATYRSRTSARRSSTSRSDARSASRSSFCADPNEEARVVCRGGTSGATRRHVELVFHRQRSRSMPTRRIRRTRWA